MENPTFLGALPDLRPKDKKLKDYKHEERGFASAAPIEWKELNDSDLIGFPIKRQYYTSECAAQSGAKHLGANNFVEKGEYVDLSGEFVYDFRSNKNTKNPGGMAWDDLMKILSEKGACHADRMEQRIRESDPVTPITPAMLTEALQYRGEPNYFDLENITIDGVAEIIQRQGSCLVWFWFDVEGTEWWKEWPSVKYPSLTTYSSKATRHAVFSRIYGLRNGKKVIVIEDSAGNNSALNNQIRFIDEGFLKRCFKAGYIVDMKNVPEPLIPKPRVKLTRLLKVGHTHAEVKLLQEVLMYEGLLKIEKPTIYFRGLTLKAVENFQKKHDLVPDGVVGPITRKVINNLYK